MSPLVLSMVQEKLAKSPTETSDTYEKFLMKATDFVEILGLVSKEIVLPANPIVQSPLMNKSSLRVMKLIAIFLAFFLVSVRDSWLNL